MQLESQANPLVSEIISTLHERYKYLNVRYEAAWTDSWSHRRCFHAHQTLIDAAKCGSMQGCGWYVFALDIGEPRQLTEAEDRLVNEFRFAK